MRWSSTNALAMSVPASLNRKKMSGKPASASAALHTRIAASADKGVLGEGFQIVMSPQIAARRRRGAPYSKRFDCALHHAFVIGGVGRVNVAEHFTAGRIDRLYDAGVARGRPLAVADIGAGVLGRQTQAVQDRGEHRKLPK